MDWDSDQLVYTYTPEGSSDELNEDHCPLCSSDSYSIHERPVVYVRMKPDARIIPFQEALTGRMVNYVEIFKTVENAAPRWESMLNFVEKGMIGSLQCSLYMQDVPPNGTWLSPKAECRTSLYRLRCAGLMCVQLPELNRIVVEQKNDDGLLYLANKWLQDKKNMSQSIELFGPFACDAMLAPILHKILRSGWVGKRKEQRSVNHELKLGWAQEFYDFNKVPRDKTGLMVFAYPGKCLNEGNVEIYNLTKDIVDKMRWCGFTPWAAVYAVRSSEDSILNLDCRECKNRFLSSCTFLLECAATEASREHDWLVRNEAVIQLCWVLWHIYKENESDHKTEIALESWVDSTVIHSLALNEYEGDVQDAEKLVVLFANDHLAVRGVPRKNAESGASVHQLEVSSDLLAVIIRNDRFKPNWKPTADHLTSVSADETEAMASYISTAADVLEKVQDGMREAKAQRLEQVTKALVSCFPRVALGNLTFSVPKTRKFTRSSLWPLFVNPTRSCYGLFRAIALPVSPEPAYILELLARAWRCIPRRTLERFIPMCSGGHVHIDGEHYHKYFHGPLKTLALFGVISNPEMDLMIKVLNQGVLPCFAAEGDSAPDRLVSSTVALTFAACGLRVLGVESNSMYGTDGQNGTTVTIAGLLYFVAWYILVYTSTLHTHPTLNKLLARTGTDADKSLLTALNSETVIVPGVHSVDYNMCREKNVGEILKALRVVFGATLHSEIILRCAQLFVPELLMQLPFTCKLGIDHLPDSVKRAIESRDIWFSETYLNQVKSYPLSNEPPFHYLGNLAYGLHSSIQGTLSNSKTTPIAQALNGYEYEFDPWYGSLEILTTQENEDEESSAIFEQSLRLSLDKQIDKQSQMFSADHDQQGVYECGISQTRSEKLPILDIESQEKSHGAISNMVLTDHVQPDAQPDGIPNNDTEKPLFQNTETFEICKGIFMDSELGFNGRNTILVPCTKIPVEDDLPRSIQHSPGIQTPCMRMLLDTGFSISNFDPTIRTESKCASCKLLIKALWVLLAFKRNTMEPQTPEALAVLVHLAAKRIQNDTGEVSEFGICNNIQALCQPCQEESDFLPIIAIVGGLFQLNVTLHTNPYTYHIFNKHYKNQWAPGSVWYSDGEWHVICEGRTTPVNIPREAVTPNCYHRGPIQAYMRLNNLKVLQVPSDDYCGFHTVATLLKIKDTNLSVIRINLARNTARYMIQNKHNDRIQTYLQDNNITTEQDIVALLSESKRWLHEHEVSFLLEAHGVFPQMINEYSYPLYNSYLTCYLIKGTHYEPVLPMDI